MDEIVQEATKKPTNYAIGFIIMVIFLIIFAIIWFILHSNGLTYECNSMQISTPNNILSPINPGNNTTFQNKLKNYYILTAYNCCSIGSLQNDFVSTCALTSILMQGVRCLDMEIYSINNQPVVATKGAFNTNIATKETYNSVPFSSVMTVISQNAFSSANVPNSTDPLFLHLRFSSQNTQMFQNLANTFQQYDSLLLGSNYSYANNGQNFGDTNLSELQNKIVVFADQSNSSFLDVPQLLEYVNMVSNGLYMRCLNYYDVLNTPDLPELQLYNCINMTIVLPDQQSNSVNPNPSVCMEAGCHFVAMQFQQINDPNLQQCIAFFNQNGYAFALKDCPETDITIPDAIPQTELVSYQTREVSGNSYSFQI